MSATFSDSNSKDLLNVNRTNLVVLGCEAGQNTSLKLAEKITPK